MARILSISSSEVLRTTRQMLLEKEGHTAVSPVDIAEVENMPKDEKFDLAIVGHGFRGEEKRRLAHLINHHFPGLPILELCFHSPEIPGADFVLADSPKDLLTAVSEILAGRRVRGFTA
jgi:hypothetical protein